MELLVLLVGLLVGWFSRCSIPGYPSDSFVIQNDNHSLLVNQSIPLTNGKWDQCHVLSSGGVDVVVGGNMSVNTTYAVNSSSQSECEDWVFDHSTFDSTIATDVSCKYICIVIDFVSLRAHFHVVRMLWLMPLT